MNADKGTTIKTASTGAVVGLWWSATKQPEECLHPPQAQMYTRIIGGKDSFYQEFCNACGKVMKEEGIRP
jgi:hypothetical protein